MALGIFISAGTSVYAAEQIQDSQNQVDKVAKSLKTYLLMVFKLMKTLML